MFWGLLLVLVSKASGASPACPKPIEHPDSKKLSYCNSQGRLTEEHFFKLQNGQLALAEINHYSPDDSRVQRRDIHQAHFGQPAQYQFTYDASRPHFQFVEKIEIANLEGQLQKVYHVKPDDHFIQELQQRYQPKPISALILDTGFEWTHPLLIDKHYVNTADPINGRDDDQDGWIDNVTTIQGWASGGGSVDYVFNHNERLQIKDKGEPNSHGTFVASVAMRDIQNSHFLGASGSLDSPAFLYKMMDLIRKKNIRFTNMSFGFGDNKAASFIDRDSHQALADFVQSTPNTLHVVAAGNHGINFDESKFSEYPACLRSANRITVGALQTDDIEIEKLATYQRSKMSSYGTRCVDIFAPGERVVGAGLYPDEIRASGTSVASPFALNVLLKIHDRAPELSSLDFKKILLLTAYIPQTGFLPSRSGGIIHPSRALAVAEKIAQGWELLDAVQHERITSPAPFEEFDQEKILAWWQKHRLLP